MKCAFGFVLMFVFVVLAGCDKAQTENGISVRAYNINPMLDLRCADGVLYIRIGTQGYAAKINKETLLPERCN